MFRKLRMSVGLLYARMVFRKKKDPVVRFTNAVSRAQRALVVLPSIVRDASAVQWVLRYLADRFRDGNLVVIGREEVAAALEKRDVNNVVEYNQKDLNAWFVPRPRLRQNLKKTTFDVAIDLNTEFELAGAFLCRESNAPLRVSFAKDHADRFFNFQVQTKSAASVTLAYRNLIRCLEMF